MPHAAAPAATWPIALLDLDGTLCDYNGAMLRDMERLRAPGEAPPEHPLDDDPPHIKARRGLIKAHPGWWRALEPLPLGFAIVEELRALEFRLHVLTKGPFDTPSAWSEKVEWCRRHLPDCSITVTEDKGLTYGKVLVDDWPPYALRWLEWRPRGLVVMPAHPWNADFEHPNVLRYDGSDRATLVARLRALRESVAPPRQAP